MDLAKREVRLRAQPQRTFRRETTMPRQATDRPEREVNARILRPDTSKGEQLASILGLANKVGQNILSDRKAVADERDAADAVLDFNADHQNQDRYKQSIAYRNSWQKAGAKKMALDISEEVSQAVNDRLNDLDHPATLADVDAVVEGIFHKHLTDGNGNPLDFGTPEAKTILGNALMEVKASIMPQAVKAIKDQTDDKYLATAAHNAIYEHFRGAPIGAPIEVKADPLAPLPEGVQDAQPGRLMEPFKGFLTEHPSSVMGAPREGGSTHNGEDYPLAANTPLRAPGGGKVIASFANDRGGNQVRIQMADGTIVGFAHLNKRNVKVGDTVQAGQVFGLSGSTGHSTGPHVHMTVERDGKKVSAKDYFQHAQAAPDGSVVTFGNEPQLATLTQAPAPAVQRAPFDFEGLMKDLPPTINKTKAKGYFLNALVAQAVDNKDPSILNDLEDSARKDGTPSFTPEERLKIANTREALRERLRVETERAEKKLQDDNADKVLEAIAGGNTPSTSWLADQGRKGLLDDRFVASMIEHSQVEARQAAREAKSDAREAQRDVDDAIDAEVYGMEAERRAGIISGASYDEDLKRYQAGEFGVVGTKKAAARLARLRGATRTGQQAVESDPQFARYASQLSVNFKPRKAQNGNLLLARPTGDVDEPTYKEMVSTYEQKVHSGMPPAQAYSEVVKQFGGKTTKKDELASIREQIAALRKQRAGAR